MKKEVKVTFKIVLPEMLDTKIMVRPVLVIWLEIPHSLKGVEEQKIRE